MVSIHLMFLKCYKFPFFFYLHGFRKPMRHFSCPEYLFIPNFAPVFNLLIKPKHK